MTRITRNTITVAAAVYYMMMRIRPITRSHKPSGIEYWSQP